MKNNERTYLLQPSLAYVEFNGLHGNKRFRVHKVRCCLYAAFIALTVMALVALISYMANRKYSGIKAINESMWSDSLKSTYDYQSDIFFLPEELKAAIESGNAAIRDRYLADLVTKELPSPSPSSRHQYSVTTDIKAKQLSTAAIGELAATKTIEETRTKMGLPSAVGQHFDVGWAPKGACKEFITFPCEVSKYRSFNGNCNAKQNYGAAYTPFRRILPPDYADGVEVPRRAKNGKLLPTARDVSLRVHKPSLDKNPSFTVMLAVFGQFIDHDITATAISKGVNGRSLSCCLTPDEHPECFPVKLSKDDPNYKISGSTCMEFVRSSPAAQCKIGPRQQLNQVSAFIDGSVIYGGDIQTSFRLRKQKDGLLEMIETSFNTTLLPPSMDIHDGCNREHEIAKGRYCFDSGDKRANENLHLTTMHVIWARQHNLLAKKLKEINPSWDDQKLFQESRRILASQLQHITYNEFLPVILGDNVTEMHNLRPLKSGFRKRTNLNINPSVANVFASAAFRFAHTLIPGLMKVANADNSSETFVTLHRIFFNPYRLYLSDGFDETIKSVLSTSIQKSSPHVTSELSQHLFEDTGKNQSQLSCGLDLVSLNIQRGRDHGLPSYPNWREYCLQDRPKFFDDLKGKLDPESLDEISKLYSSVEDVDLYTGALAEKTVPNGLVGPTFSCLIADQFVRLQMGDRYYYEMEGEEGSFTEGQLDEIRKTTLAKVICDSSDNIDEIPPQVMLTTSDSNPPQSCDSLPVLDLTLWKE